MKITCISDLHGEFCETIGGDLLIIAGDCTSNDSVPAWNNFFNWLDHQNYRKKIMIAGNHDNFCKQWALSNDSIYNVLEERPSVTYLCDSGIEFEGLKIWGTPWTHWFQGINPHCKAFTGSEKEIAKKFELIPDDTDILISHCPPYGIFDETSKGENVGSKYLRNKVINVNSNIRLHVFGHIHEHGGHRMTTKRCEFINASYMDENYEPVNKPINLEISCPEKTDNSPQILNNYTDEYELMSMSRGLAKPNLMYYQILIGIRQMKHKNNG